MSPVLSQRQAANISCWAWKFKWGWLRSFFAFGICGSFWASLKPLGKGSQETCSDFGENGGELSAMWHVKSLTKYLARWWTVISWSRLSQVPETSSVNMTLSKMTTTTQIGDMSNGQEQKCREPPLDCSTMAKSGQSWPLDSRLQACSGCLGSFFQWSAASSVPPSSWLGQYLSCHSDCGAGGRRSDPQEIHTARRPLSFANLCPDANSLVPVFGCLVLAVGRMQPYETRTEACQRHASGSKTPRLPRTH